MADQEIAPGVVVAHDGDCPAVYINDEQGEVCMWIYDEIVEDPAAWTASLGAVAMAATAGPPAVRKLLNGGISDEEAALRRAWHHLNESIQAIYEARIEHRGGMGTNMEGLNGALAWLAEELKGT